MTFTLFSPSAFLPSHTSVIDSYPFVFHKPLALVSSFLSPHSGSALTHPSFAPRSYPSHSSPCHQSSPPFSPHPRLSELIIFAYPQIIWVEPQEEVVRSQPFTVCLRQPPPTNARASQPLCGVPSQERSCGIPASIWPRDRRIKFHKTGAGVSCCF